MNPEENHQGEGEDRSHGTALGGKIIVNQHWKDPEIAPMSYQIFKSWKNIPDIVLSIDTSIRK